jgi:hypothetical protein
LGVSERIIGISIISYGKNILDLRPTWVTTSPLKRTKFVSQGPTVDIDIHIDIGMDMDIDMVMVMDIDMDIDTYHKFILMLAKKVWLIFM